MTASVMISVLNSARVSGGLFTATFANSLAPWTANVEYLLLVEALPQSQVT